MKENPNDAILDSAGVSALAEQHIGAQLDLLRDLANYGSNLVLRAFNSSPKEMVDIVICGVMLKQVTAMTDSVEVLLRAGCTQAAFLPSRASFEASVYLDWILEPDSDVKARRYIVGNYRDQREWAKRATPGSAQEATMQKALEPFKVDIHATRPALAADVAAAVAEADRVLGATKLAPIDQEFDAARGKRRFDVEWYELDGLLSIRQVAEKVGRLAEYEIFYSRGSQVMHTGTYQDHVHFSKTPGSIKLKPVRTLEEVGPLINFTASTCIGTYRKVLDRYRPMERPAFNKKYAEDWREPFLNVPKVKYNY